HFTFTKDANAVGRALRQARLAQRGWIDGRAVVECFVKVADIDDEKASCPGSLAEAALGDAAEKLHLAAFEERGRLLGAGAGPLALTAACAGLAVARARTAADALLALQLVNAVMNRG